MAAPSERKQPRRKAQISTAQVGLPQQVIEKRTKRHLEELERTNYTEPAPSLAGIGYGESTASARGRARETISDKRVIAGGVRKKIQSKNVRDALVYRKNLATLIEESNMYNYRELLASRLQYLHISLLSHHLPPSLHVHYARFVDIGVDTNAGDALWRIVAKAAKTPTMIRDANEGSFNSVLRKLFI